LYFPIGSFSIFHQTEFTLSFCFSLLGLNPESHQKFISAFN
jgi:hypothetical protein